MKHKILILFYFIYLFFFYKILARKCWTSHMCAVWLFRCCGMAGECRRSLPFFLVTSAVMLLGTAGPALVM